MQHFNPASSPMTRYSRRSSSGGGGGLVALAIVGALVVANQGGSASGKIAFANDSTGNYQIYVTDADFQSMRQITDSDAHSGEPDWSADGTRIAFVTERDADLEIYVMGADGDNARNVTNDPATDGGPRFPTQCLQALQPCENWLLFHSDRDGDYELYLTDMTNGDVLQLTDNECDDRWAQWSPDGTQLVYMSDCASGSWDIFVLDLLADDIRQYTDTPDTDDVFPAWSPDGETIIFVTGGFFSFRIALMDADCADDCGADQRLLLPQFDPDDEIGVEETDPAFSPDGEWVLFSSNRDLEADDSFIPIQDDYEQFRVRLNGEDLTQLTDNEDINDVTPDWIGGK